LKECPPRHFFADLLLPLKRANMRKGVYYLRLLQGESSWGNIASRTNGLEKLSIARGGAVGILELLGQYWATQDDRNLPKLIPELLALRQKIMEPLQRESERETPCPNLCIHCFEYSWHGGLTRVNPALPAGFSALNGPEQVLQSRA